MATEMVFLGFLGAQELIIVSIVILVLFGTAKIPKFMGSLGKGINEFKKASKGGDVTTGDSEETKLTSVSSSEAEVKKNN